MKNLSNRVTDLAGDKIINAAVYPNESDPNLGAQSNYQKLKKMHEGMQLNEQDKR